MRNKSRIKTIIRLAEAGDAEAQFRLGQWYGGLLTPQQDDAAACKWYWSSANLGHVGAKLALLDMLVCTRVGEEYQANVMRWGEELSEQGNARAQVSLSFILGYASSGDPGFIWLQKAAENNYAPALYLLGEAYQLGDGDTRDEKKAYELFYKAALLGDAPSQYSLGMMYVEGRVVPRDAVEAAKWLRKAEAWADLGEMSEKEETLQGDQEAIMCYRNAAREKYDVRGNYLLGRMYERGRGVAQDYETAARYYWRAVEQGVIRLRYKEADFLNVLNVIAYNGEKDVPRCQEAANQGNSNAMVVLGSCYYGGYRGVLADKEKASKYFQQAAEQNNVMGQFCSGYMIAIESGGANNPEAMQCFLTAANQGFADAQALIGRTFYCDEKFEDAAKWYVLAAEQGNLEAQSFLGPMYFYGKGVAQDYEAAAKCFRSACEWSFQSWEERIRELVAVQY